LKIRKNRLINYDAKSRIDGIFGRWAEAKIVSINGLSILLILNSQKSIFIIAETSFKVVYNLMFTASLINILIVFKH
jgi:hypothetical protein